MNPNRDCFNISKQGITAISNQCFKTLSRETRRSKFQLPKAWGINHNASCKPPEHMSNICLTLLMTKSGISQNLFINKVK